MFLIPAPKMTTLCAVGSCLYGLDDAGMVWKYIPAAMYDQYWHRLTTQAIVEESDVPAK